MIIIKIYKEKQFLIFDFEDGRTCKYDFATKTSIGIKGKPVDNLKHQLQGYTLSELWDCFEDQNYARFLRYIENTNYRSGMSNLGTILTNVPYYRNLEQIFSANIDDVVCLSKNINFTIKDIPKSLIKMAKKHHFRISRILIEFYKENPDAHLIVSKLNFVSLNDEDIHNVISKTPNYYSNNPYSYFNKLISTYGYNAKTLWLYLDRLKTLEALNLSEIMREIYDYAKMMSDISCKYDKYPRNFLTTHAIACRNYN